MIPADFPLLQFEIVSSVTTPAGYVGANGVRPSWGACYAPLLENMLAKC